MGKVTFVGGGPYDQAYITLAAKETLMDADVVLYDALLHEELLELTNGTCICVGKRKGHHSWRQEEINDLLVEQAKQHRHVVRLKGGDSLIFGRGGEEAMVLHKHHIPFTFLPGISSVIAASELAGIPLTHRGISKGFQVFSAHLQDHHLGFTKEDVKNPEITQVILMGLTRVQEICDLFLEAGRSPATPIAIISKGASYEQKVLCATLSTISQKLKQTPLDAPAIIVIGEVVTLRKELCFFERSIWFGKQILVTKVQQESSFLTTLLKKEGAIVKELTLGHIKPCHFTLSPSFLEEAHTLIFTSRNAITSFFDTVLSQYDIRSLYQQSFLVIGEKTAQALRTYGIRELAHAHGSRTQLQNLIQRELELHHTCFYCKGSTASSIAIHQKVIPELIVYENEPVSVTQAYSTYDLICFTCASSVERYPYSLEHGICISIGPTTTKALRMRHVTQIIEAKTPSYEAMVDACIQAIHKGGEQTCIEVEG